MCLLLDTHVLLWAVGMSARLPVTVRQLLESPGNEIYYSAANLWEIAIKSGLGRTDFQVDPERLLEALPAMDFAELPITARHAATVARLPPLHKDPFDRLLVAQSRTEPMILLTNDEGLSQYGDNVRLIG
ncbi:MAG: type II toxin-antitoxin system VapC family toxin [Candidatus Contendobacter sp.]|nr:type II toxin-antitoxin system VapC family toxin [Candidatus Contendobacter sp.]MDG4559273.1 type II toxin-antitoxin system VapC family toxin [Candidatus Contendobacter sp.]